MKTLFCIIAAVLLACGCNPSQNSSPVKSKTNQPVQATNYAPVVGGFGWKLRQFVPTNQDTTYETNGVFQLIVLFTTTNRQIYTICGCTLKNPLSRDDFKSLLKALDRKYGYVGNFQDKDGTGYVFGLPDSVKLYDYSNTTEICYVAEDLSKQFKKQQEDKKINAFKNF